jgi:hypothetical protein
MFQTVPLSIIRSFSVYTQQWCMLYRFADSLLLLCVQWKTHDDGQRNCLKHVDFYSKNKFEKLVHLVGFITRRFIWNVDTCLPKYLALLSRRPLCFKYIFLSTFFTETKCFYWGMASLTLAIEMPGYFTNILKYALLPSALYLQSHDSLYRLWYFFECLAIDVLPLNIQINSIQFCHHAKYVSEVT